MRGENYSIIAEGVNAAAAAVYRVNKFENLFLLLREATINASFNPSVSQSLCVCEISHPEG
jgi:hypothetical protein